MALREALDKTGWRMNWDVLFNQGMTPPATSDYRFSRVLITRLVGSALVLFALVVFGATAIVAVTGVPPDLLVVLLVVGGIVVGGFSSRLRTTLWAVRFDQAGYRVRMIRGAGVKQATWSEVEGVVTATPREIPCVVVRLTDGRTTTIPMPALEVDREVFVRDLQAHLDRGRGLKPL